MGNRVEFHWGPDAVNGSLGAKVTTCRNSVQGKVLLADDQGEAAGAVDELFEYDMWMNMIVDVFVGFLFLLLL